MRCAYFHCVNGASGDMVLGALVDAGVPLHRLQEAIDTLGVGLVVLEAETVQRGGLKATQVRVHLNEPSPSSRAFSTLMEMVQQASLSPQIKDDSIHVLLRLGEAEARVHRTPMEDLHLHELGSLDTLADIVGSVAGLAEMGVESVFSSALPAGSGMLQGEHGVLPVPAPAVLELVRDAKAPLITSRKGDETGELVTPTGAAILTSLASFQPTSISIEEVGYGAGNRDPQDRPNVLAIWVGEVEASVLDLVLVETTIDDMNPELYGYVRDVLMSEGARDVWLAPVQMKKDRPGVIVSALGSAAAEGKLVEVLFRETSTLGARVTQVRRHEVSRTVAEVQTVLGSIRVKLKHFGGQVSGVSPEYEDCRRIAGEHAMPLQEVYRVARRAAEDRFMAR